MTKKRFFRNFSFENVPRGILGAESEFYTQNDFRDTFDKNPHPPKFTPKTPKSEKCRKS